MARARSGGGFSVFGPALVLFVMLAVIAATMAILFYVQLGDARNQVQQANEQLEAVVTKNEQTSPAYRERASQAGSGTSVWSIMQSDISELKRMLAGSDARSIEEIRADLEAKDVDPTQMSALDRITNLQREVAAVGRNLAAMEDQYRAATDREAKAQSALASLRAQFDELEQETEQTIAALNEKFESHMVKEASSFQGYEAQFAEIREAHAAEISDLSTTISLKDAEISLLRERIRDLEAEQARVSGDLSSEYTVDGRVASVVSERDLVYIDIGLNDRVLRGMTFEVFNPLAGVVRDETGELRGKATIEVINVFENASVARIVRQERGTSVVADDVIANVVYDKNAQLKFYVFGDFDLANTGRPNRRDRRTVESLVTRWGGVLADDLSYDTDFLVLGPEPEFPREPRDETTEAYRQYQAALEQYNRYQELVAEARTLSIPVLNQNRFLVLVGYYER